MTPEQVVAALFEQAWTIVHIAAHGVFDFELQGPDGTARKETGIVLGGGLFLGPSILDQLPVVPAIVFVNCCHLGHIDPAAEAAAPAQIGQRPEPRRQRRGAARPHGRARRGRGRLGGRRRQCRRASPSASMMAMLGGRQVRPRRSWRRDRRSTARAAQDTTWGAYQCYGEPDWRLVEDGATGAAATAPADASLAEAVAMAEEIREAAQVGLDRDPRRPARRARRASTRRGAAIRSWTGPSCRRRWPRPMASWARCRRRCATTSAPSLPSRAAVSLRAIEQHANLKARLAVRRAPRRRQAKEQRDGVRRAIEAALTLSTS